MGEKAEFNVGVDMTMFDNRLSFTFDYYKRTTSNLLYDYIVPTPPYVYNTLFTNVGKVTNEGVELTISGTPLTLETLHGIPHLPFRTIKTNW